MLTATLLPFLLGALTTPPHLPEQQAPTLRASYTLHMKQGRFGGHACMTELPRSDSVRFVLNNGFNVRNVRSLEGRVLRLGAHSQLNDIGIVYVVKDSAAMRGFCIDYVGAFPIYDTDTLRVDSVEQIAFNGWTARFAWATAWYPIVLDSAGAYRSRVSATVAVACPDCHAIFLTGAAPVRGTRLQLDTRQPRELTFFAGDFAFRTANGIHFINGGRPGSSRDVPAETRQVFARSLQDVERTYERWLERPFTDTLVLLRHIPTMTMGPGNDWGFMSWPAFAFAGYDFGDFVQSVDGRRVPNTERIVFLGHELAHYYFRPQDFPGPLAQFFGESVAEYMAARTLRDVAGGDASRKRLAFYLASLARATTSPPGLHEVTTAHPFGGDLARYRYGPLLLFALEREIGSDHMTKFLRELLSLPRDREIGYDDMQGAVLRAGADRAAWERFDRSCVRTAPRESCIQSLATAP